MGNSDGEMFTTTLNLVNYMEKINNSLRSTTSLALQFGAKNWSILTIIFLNDKINFKDVKINNEMLFVTLSDMIIAYISEKIHHPLLTKYYNIICVIRDRM